MSIGGKMATCCHFKTQPRRLRALAAIIRFGRNVASYKFAPGGYFWS